MGKKEEKRLGRMDLIRGMGPVGETRGGDQLLQPSSSASYGHRRQAKF
jgi:hypothetical protein